MTYKLAKELKDAGYTLRRIEAGACVGPWPVLDMNPSGSQEIGAQHFYAPTLSELVEECGDNLQSLHNLHDLNRWDAVSYSSIGTGITPEEAVAYLWLELNIKNAT